VFNRVIKQKVALVIFCFLLQPETARDGKGKYDIEGEVRNRLIRYSALISLTKGFTVVKKFCTEQ